MVNIVDAPMGAGKSSALINYMNSPAGDNVKFIYVTPYLNEVERIISKCPSREFAEPLAGCDTFTDTKLKSLKELLRDGRNVSTTHALFFYFDDEVMEMIGNQNYVLIMDEVADVVSSYIKDSSHLKCRGITRDDFDLLLRDCAFIDRDTQYVRWKNFNYDGNLNEYRIACEANSIVVYGSCDFPLWVLPVNRFNCFKDVYVLTYMFNAQIQRYYYDAAGIKYRYLGVDKVDDEYVLSDYKKYVQIYDYKSLINICENEKLNRLGEPKTALCKNWYMKNKGLEDIRQLKSNTYNYFRNICHSKANNNLWTTFKSFRFDIRGKGYSKGFLQCNARATNEYRDRNCVAYLINLYLNPVIKNYFIAQGVDVDEDGYALSEMLQFIWRSAIRQGLPINLYVPSSRMRTMLKEWIENNTLNK